MRVVLQIHIISYSKNKLNYQIFANAMKSTSTFEWKGVEREIEDHKLFRVLLNQKKSLILYQV